MGDTILLPSFATAAVDGLATSCSRCNCSSIERGSTGCLLHRSDHAEVPRTGWQ
jgi:hypothetical protein